MSGIFDEMVYCLRFIRLLARAGTLDGAWDDLALWSFSAEDLIVCLPTC